MLARTSTGRPIRRVLVHGLVYFGEVFANFMSGEGWEFEYYPDHGAGNLLSMARALARCDLVYQIGGRVTTGKFLRVAKLAGKRRIVMHWVGSDTLDQKAAVAAGKSEPSVINGIHHWADSEWIFNEVAALGVPCDLVPFPSARIPAKPSPLPTEFCVLVYVPSVERAQLYGLDMILEVARQLPHVRFELVGLRDGPILDLPLNISVNARIPELTQFYKQATVVWRSARHDGLSWMVLEALGHGRHVLWTYPFPGCLQASSATEAQALIQRLYRLHQEGKLKMNCEGACFIARSEFQPQRFKANIRSRLEKILES